MIRQPQLPSGWLDSRPSALFFCTLHSCGYTTKRALSKRVDVREAAGRKILAMTGAACGLGIVTYCEDFTRENNNIILCYRAAIRSVTLSHGRSGPRLPVCWLFRILTYWLRLRRVFTSNRPCLHDLDSRQIDLKNLPDDLPKNFYYWFATIGILQTPTETVVSIQIRQFHLCKKTWSPASSIYFSTFTSCSLIGRGIILKILFTCVGAYVKHLFVWPYPIT